MKKTILTGTLVGIFSITHSQSVTWAKDIAPIFYKNCTTCHHDGGAGHFSLLDYQNAFSHAFSIQYKTENKQMPPFPTDPSYRKFKDERRLSDAEIQTIKDWYNAGAPMGDTNTAPTQPIYTNLPELTTPSKILQIPTYSVSSNYDVYQCFVLDPQLSQDEYFDAYEVIPGNPSIVHHVLIYEDTTGVSTTKDAQTPEPGYLNFGGIGVASAKLIGAWVPGSKPQFYPPNIGVKLHKNAKVVMQIHYPAGSLSKKDSTTLRLRFSNSPLREISLAPILRYANSGNGGLLNGPLSIEADEVKTFYNQYTLANNYPKISLVLTAPHMHLIGRSIMAFAVTPTNDTIPIVKIPEWDFRWQMSYYFQKPVVIPPGTKLFGKATYDNTATNPFQPNNPPKKVTAGEATTDEMFLVYFGYMLYQNGDEDMVIDSSILQLPTDLNKSEIASIVSTPQFYEPIPNPAQGATTLSFFLPNTTEVAFEVYDIAGKKVHSIPSSLFNQGFATQQLFTDALANGTYIVRMIVSEKQLLAKQLIISH